eukprot:9181035-Alexandrium_andersonii.AAC.1
MSASLVGSEMCIRDRSMSHQLYRYHWPSAAAEKRHWVAVRDTRLWRRPVSYTHLTLPTICSV